MFFKEPLTEWFFVESKRVLLWHHWEEPFKHLYFEECIFHKVFNAQQIFHLYIQLKHPIYSRSTFQSAISVLFCPPLQRFLSFSTSLLMGWVYCLLASPSMSGMMAMLPIPVQDIMMYREELGKLTPVCRAVTDVSW